jgi:hypothetical protein
MANPERELLKKAYPSKQWAEKVDKMTKAQVVAITMRLRMQNKL